MSEDISEKPVNLKEGRKINMTSRSLVRTMIQGGLAAVLAACGATSEVKKDIPQVSLHEIVNNPSLYSEVPLIRTSGYPEQTGRSIYKVPIFSDNEIDWVSRESDTYKLHVAADPKSEGIEFTLEGGMTYGPGTAFGPYIVWHPPSVEEANLYEFTGNIIQVQSMNGDKEYILKPSSFEKVDFPELPANK